MRTHGLAVVVLAAGLAVSQAARCRGQEGAERDILVTEGLWRVHVAVRPALFGTAAEGAPGPIVVREPRSKEPTRIMPAASPAPPPEWKNADFDDSSWLEMRGPFFGEQDEDLPESVLTMYVNAHAEKMAATIALLSVRRRFWVEDPETVPDLSLRARFRGGIVAYVNGTEVARGFMGDGEITPETLAQDYPPDVLAAPSARNVRRYPDKFVARIEKVRAARIRSLDDAAVPSSSLRKGWNALAIEVHRSALAPEQRLWMSCALHEIALRSGSGAVSAERMILSERSVWRGHYVWKHPVFVGSEGQSIPDKIRARYRLKSPTAEPPAGWTAPDFDDRRWERWREPRREPRIVMSDRADEPPVLYYEKEQYGVWGSASARARRLRGKFAVEDPAAVRDLRLLVHYRGGIVVYLNGKELTRQHLNQGAITPDSMGWPYTPDMRDVLFKMRKGSIRGIGKPKEGNLHSAVKALNHRIRELDLALPPEQLSKGVNVLAVELLSAAYPSEAESVAVKPGWSICGLADVRLVGRGPVVPNDRRPAGLQVWTSNLLNTVTPFGQRGHVSCGKGSSYWLVRFPLTRSDPNEPIAPVEIAAARNGTFSGQIAASSDTPIRNLKAVVGDLVHQSGTGRIAASSIRVRYQDIGVKPVSLLGRGATGGDLDDNLTGALRESPPVEIGTRRERIERLRVIDGGAVAPIWVTVPIPADAPTGRYEGTITVTADGGHRFEVPLHVRVADWTVPDPQTFRTLSDICQSPETLAFYYKTPLWSDRHFELMDISFRHLAEVAGKIIHIPLIKKMWLLYAEETMVRWVKGLDDAYTHDYTIFDKFMDLVQKHIDPELIVLHILAGERQKKDVVVSLLDPATGKCEDLTAPAYIGPEALDFWKPAIDGVMARLKQRGLEKTALFGLVPDGSPEKGVVELFQKVAPELRWVQVGHPGGVRGGVHGVPFRYAMSVYGLMYRDPLLKKGDKLLWWKLSFPTLRHHRGHSIYEIRPFGSYGAVYLASEREQVKGCGGLGPLGLDYWFLDRGRRGTRTLSGGTHLGMNLPAILSPGPDGPIPRVRFELLRESVQVAEARMGIEWALDEPTLRSQLPDELADRCRKAFEERDRIQSTIGFASGRGQIVELWNWQAGSGWEDRTFELFTLAGEVTKALGGTWEYRRVGNIPWPPPKEGTGK